MQALRAQAQKESQGDTMAYGPNRPCGGLLRDIYRGAVLGDFADDLGVPGAFTQATMGYVPGFSMLTAMRDAVADLRAGDGVGVALNVLAASPFIGGFPKTLEVVRHLRRAHTARRRSRDRWDDGRWGA